MPPIKKVTIYGERCSGTNYLEELLINNFDVEIVWDHGWKHFFGFADLNKENSQDVLFIGIVRNIFDWINSLYTFNWHIPKYLINRRKFLNSEFFSIDKRDGLENMKDRNMLTGERYKNIFELRSTKNQFLIEQMPGLVQNYLLFTYEDLTNNFEDVMNRIKEKGLVVKRDICFPINVTYYKKKTDRQFVKKKYNIFSKDTILSNLPSTNYEEILYPNFPDI